jgi:hypothetical protein
MMTLNGKTGRVGKPVPPHVAAIAEAQRLALAARVAAQETQSKVFSPVTAGVTKRQIRRRNYGKRVTA